MNRRRMIFENAPFMIIEAVIFVIIWFDLANVKIVMPIMFACLGIQQIFNGLRFYNKDKNSRVYFVLLGTAIIIFSFFITLKYYRI